MIWSMSSKGLQSNELPGQGAEIPLILSWSFEQHQIFLKKYSDHRCFN